MESKIFGYIIGVIVSVFVGMIFLTNTMIGFLPYREQTKQVALITQAQVEMTQINADKEITLASMTNPLAVLSWWFGCIVVMFFSLFVLVLFKVLRH